MEVVTRWLVTTTHHTHTGSTLKAPFPSAGGKEKNCDAMSRGSTSTRTSTLQFLVKSYTYRIYQSPIKYHPTQSGSGKTLLLVLGIVDCWGSCPNFAWGSLAVSKLSLGVVKVVAELCVVNWGPWRGSAKTLLWYLW